MADQLTPALSFPAARGSHFRLLRWGYDIDAAVSGSVALAPEAGLKFAADGSRAGLYALVRLIEDGPGCADIVRDPVSSWRLPSQVKDVADLLPGTWIIAETNGAASWSVNATYGYNLNWIRAATLGTLKGDTGLKVQIGLAADLAFKVSGKHAVILSRGTGAEKDQIRLRLYRIGVREWDFGFSASAIIQRLLKADGNKNAQFYYPGRATRIIQTAIKHPGTLMLFSAESTLVDNARSAGVKIAQFLASRGSQQDVQDESEVFGARLTKTFNTDLSTWATDSLLLPLGPVLLVEAAQVFENPAAVNPSNAMFTVQAKNVPGSKRLTRIAAPAT